MAEKDDLIIKLSLRVDAAYAKGCYRHPLAAGLAYTKPKVSGHSLNEWIQPAVCSRVRWAF